MFARQASVKTKLHIRLMTYKFSGPEQLTAQFGCKMLSLDLISKPPVHVISLGFKAWA